MLAAVIGFGAAQFLVPQGWPVTAQPARLDSAEARLADQGRGLADLQAAVEALRATPGAADDDRIAALDGALDALRSETTALSDTLTEMQTRLAALEDRPASAPAAADPGTGAAFDPDALARALDDLRAGIEAATGDELAAIRAEIAALRNDMADLRASIPDGPDPELAARLEEQVAALAAAAEAERTAHEARLATLQAEAEARSRDARARSALLEVQAAVENGADFGAALTALAATGERVPAALAERATGVPTLAQVQASFAPAARAALGAVVGPQPDQPAMDRALAFLRAQTGARSLTPRAGEDADAVLSRAEAAVRAGDLPAALAELDALPPEAAAAMAPWRNQAQARAEATAALAELAAGLTGN